MNAPELNVTLPAHNEAAQLAASVRRVVACLAAQPWPWELVIADNGSRDATGAIADQLVAEHEHERTAVGGHSGGVIRARHRAAPGRGAALREAWLGSDAAIVSYLDVDLSTDLACLPALLAPLQCGAADLAIGSRLLAGSLTTRGWKRELISRTYNRLLRTALGLAVHDAALRQGWRTAEVPVRWVDDPGSTVKLASTIWRDLRGVWRLRRRG